MKMPKHRTYGFLNTVKEWGGGEKWHFEVAKLLHHEGHHVVMYTYPGSVLCQQSKKAGLIVKEVALGKYSYFNPVTIIRLANQLRQDDVQTLIMNLSSDMKVGALAGNRANVDRVIYRRGSAIPIKNSRINRKILSQYVHEILTNSESTKQTIFENNHAIFDPKKVKVIYNPIEMPDINLTSRKPSKTLIIGNAGRLYKQKGQTHLIDLARILKDRNVECIIKIAGEGVERKHLTNLITKYRLEDHIQLLGFVDDLEDFYRSLDVFAMTSLWEGFGFVIAEAMSYGVPVVGFDVSSNPELIQSGHNGFLVEKGDMESFADAIVFIQKARDRFSCAAREYVESHFEKSIINNQLLEYLVNPSPILK